MKDVKRLVVEIAPELHQRIRIIVARRNMTLRQWVEMVLREGADKEEEINQ